MDCVTKVLLTFFFTYITLLSGVGAFQNDPQCGRSHFFTLRDPKIIGGENVDMAEFPWHVSIKESGKHKCGGFIINKSTVLTAAHCFKDFSDRQITSTCRAANSPKTISVTLALHYLSLRGKKLSGRKKHNLYSKWEQDVKVQRIMRHPQYDAFSKSAKFDIAILLLETQIQWKYGAGPVCLPTSSRRPNTTTHTSDPIDHMEEVAIVVGWASHEHANLESADENTLKRVDLTLYNHEECQRIFREKNINLKTEIDSSVICAGSDKSGYDSCSGDSGSALLIQRDGVWVAIGIVSSGFGSCGSGPGLYTRISSYLDWIDMFTKVDQARHLPAFKN